MPITYPLAFPTVPKPQSVRMLTMNVVAETISPFSLQEQTQVHTGQRWEADVTIPPMIRADAELWIAFLLKLRGKSGTFLFGDPAGEVARGIATGTPLVDGASQTGNELDTKGWTTGQTGIMKAGDYFSLGSGTSTQLYKVLDDANSDGGGLATLLIWPSLRFSPANSAPLDVTAAKGLFKLASNETSWDINTALHYGIAFAIMESIPNV